MRLGTADILVRAKTGEYKKDVEGAKELTKDFGKAAVEDIGKITTAFTVLSGTVAASLGLITKEAMEFTTELEKSATMAGVSVTSYQELEYAAKQYSISQDALTDGLKELNLRAEEFVVTGAGPGKEAFERLGFSQGELNKRLNDTPLLLGNIISRLKDMDQAARMRIADEIFGGQGGEQFVAMINGGADALENFTEQAHSLSLVLSEETIKNTNEARKALGTLSDQMRNQLISVVGELAPEIKNMADQMGTWVSANKVFLTQDVPSHVSNIAGAFLTLGKTAGWAIEKVSYAWEWWMELIHDPTGLNALNRELEILTADLALINQRLELAKKTNQYTEEELAAQRLNVAELEKKIASKKAVIQLLEEYEKKTASATATTATHTETTKGGSQANRDYANSVNDIVIAWQNLDALNLTDKERRMLMPNEEDYERAKKWLDQHQKDIDDAKEAEIAAVQDAADKQERAYERMYDSVKGMTKDLTQTLIDNWHDMGDALTDYFTNTLKNMAAEAAATPVIVPIKISTFNAWNKRGE